MDIIENIREALLSNADEVVKEKSFRFFKETINNYGVKAAIVHKISKEALKLLKGASKDEIFTHCETLWKSGVMEESLIACDLSFAQKKYYIREDFTLFKGWIENYVTNWATCDSFCNHTVGSFIVQYPEYLQELKQFCTSDNRWMKRAATVSLIVPARRGEFLDDIFELAEKLLTDVDDMVQKGYGWMLKEASKKHQTEVFEFVLKHKETMPRTALRYAIEKMPQEMRKEAMKK